MVQVLAEDCHYLAAFTIQLWELLFNIEDDIKWIWLKPSSWIKWVFLFMRYGTVPVQGLLVYQHFHSHFVPYVASECRPWALLRNLFPLCLFTSTQSILVARVFALYDRNTRILCFLCGMFIPGSVFSLFTIGQILSSPLTFSADCHPLTISNNWAYVITSMFPLFLDFSMLMLTIRRAYQLSRGPFAEPILYIVLRDGTWAFFLVWSSVIIGSSLMTLGYGNAAFIIMNAWFCVIMTFTATRLILNIRRLADKDELRRLKSNSKENVDFEDAAALTSGIALELNAFTKSGSEYLHNITMNDNSLPTTTRLRHPRADHTKNQSRLVPLL